MVVDDTISVVPSNDVEALALALRRELDSSDVLNLPARLRILDNFTVTHLGDKTEQALFLQCAVGATLDKDATSKRGSAAEVQPTGDPS